MIYEMIYGVFLALTIVDTIMMLSPNKIWVKVKKGFVFKGINSLSLLVHFEIHSVTEEISITTWSLIYSERAYLRFTVRLLMLAWKFLTFKLDPCKYFYGVEKLLVTHCTACCCCSHYYANYYDITTYIIICYYVLLQSNFDIWGYCDERYTLFHWTRAAYHYAMQSNKINGT